LLLWNIKDAWKKNKRISNKSALKKHTAKDTKAFERSRAAALKLRNNNEDWSANLYMPFCNEK
jgi:hypothetical protein